MDPNTDPEADEMGMEPVPEHQSEGESSTALLPLDFFTGGDIKPGSECRIRVERVLDGQAEVTYLQHDEESPEEDLGESPEQSGDDEMAGYMNE